MKLLAQQLQAAGLSFMYAKARHGARSVAIDEVVCLTEVDAIRVKAWAAREKLLTVTVRVATAAERAAYKLESP
jgi:hypothetical protein